MAHANPPITPADVARLQRLAANFRRLADDSRKLSISMRQLKWMAIAWASTMFLMLCALLFFSGRIILNYYGIIG